MSVQRLLVMMLAMQTLVGVSIFAYYGVSYDENLITGTSETQNEYWTEVRDSDYYAGLKDQPALDSKTIGDTPAWGRSFLGLLFGAAWPGSINPSMFDTVFEKVFAFVLVLLRSTLMILTPLMAYFVIKNKMYS